MPFLCSETRGRVALGVGLCVLSLANAAHAQLAVTTTNDGTTLSNALLASSNVVVSSATYTGNAGAAGTFTNGPLAISDGILLTSGLAQNALPPNDVPDISAMHGLPGHALCDSLAGSGTADAALLTIQFTLASGFDGIALEYVFGTEEYPEFVGQVFNDVVGIYLDGVNVGTDLSNNAITINGPFFSSTEVITATETQYDGSTPLIRRASPVTGAGLHTLEIVICDNGDNLLDSGVFVSALAGCVGTECMRNNYCGDGDTLEPGEECDDDNNESGDGCSQACTVEEGWQCTDTAGMTSGCTCAPGYVLNQANACVLASCGDGSVLAPTEQCDDNNNTNGDGCNGECQVEDGWECVDNAGQPSTCACKPGFALGSNSLCSIDTDEDMVPDDEPDNCPNTANPDQADQDLDGIGDLCDGDSDGDGFDDRVGLQGGGCHVDGTGGAPLYLLLLALALLISVRRKGWMRRIFAAWIVLVVGLGIAAPQRAEAQSLSTEFSVERFRLSTDKQGILDLEWAGIPEHLSIGTGLWLGYADDPLALYIQDQGDRMRVGSLVDYRWGAGLSASIALFNRIQLGLELPLIVNQEGNLDNVSPMAGSLSSFGVGDVRLVPKVGLLRQNRHGVALSLVAGLTVPTSSDPDFFGEKQVSFAPELLVSRAFSPSVRAGVGLGYRLREHSRALDLQVDDEIFATVGAAYSLASSTGAPVELSATVAMATGANDIAGAFNRNYSETKLAAAYSVGPITVFAGGGFGTSEGFGSPDWRFLSGLRFEQKKKKEQPAPVVVEKIDPDSDGDGLLDSVDACPTEPETVNAFQDEDGCPDEIPDTDGDGLNDQVDACPEQPEDVDQFKDEDGCPDPDNDADGILDINDACPLVPGVPPMKGCPDPDRDVDTVVDRLDNCPDEPGLPEYQGCKKKQLVQITEAKIELLDVVYFRTARAVIRPESFGLLDNVAAVLVAKPDITSIRVEGHTDDRAKDAYNKKLSQSRAEAVVAYLVKKGVAPERLIAVGFGEERPIQDNSTKEGRAANRRVEFVIVGQNGVEVQRTGPTEDTIDE